jgi:protein-disulfide isomerase
MATALVAVACDGASRNGSDNATSSTSRSGRLSAAADVPAVDVRRLPPGRNQQIPDRMLDSADAGRVLGAASASVPIYVIGDYACAACRVWFETTLPVIRRDYLETGKARLTWVHYPLREHPAAVRAASAALCASVQGKFWESSARIYAAQAQWSDTRAADANRLLDSLATVDGIDGYALRNCTDSGRLLRRVRYDIDWADSTQMGAPPLVMVGTRRLAGTAPLAMLRAVIDSVLTGK